MRIGFDARCLEEENISGVGEYTFELLKNLLKLDTLNNYVLFSNSFKQKNSHRFECFQQHPNVELKRYSFPNKILNFFFWYLNFPKIHTLIGDTSVFFVPNINFLSFSRKNRAIATFHDLSFERNANFFPLKTRLWHNYFVNPRKIARYAKKIIAVSTSTKKDLEEIYGIAPQKIEIVSHGVSDEFRPIDRRDPKLTKIRKKYGLPENFIFYLGNIEPRKNISSIITAHKKLIQINPNHAKLELVLAGNLNPLCRNLAEEKNITVCGYIERADRPYVYNMASIFVYPSFFEGFGLPILEAMACGTPSIASNNSSIPEVAGNAAILVDPNRPTELFEAMKSLLLNISTYDKFKKKGIAQANQFSWAKCAKETLSVITKVALTKTL